MLALPAPPHGTQQTWDGLILSGIVQPEGLIAYRFRGGRSARLGSWLTPQALRSSSAAIRSLALPSGNTAEFVSVVHVPGGTRIQYGRVSPAFGQPGGGIQIQLLQRIPSYRFGRGIPLPIHEVGS